MQHINQTETVLHADWARDGARLSQQNLQVRGGYWDQFYSSKQIINLQPPSQFAAFIASEYGSHPLFIDIGCGNGRDTLFFAQLGHETVGIDASSSAISLCQQSIPGDQKQNHPFIVRDVMDLPDDSALIEMIRPRKKVIYSRFFLHAIDEAEETAFFDFAFESTKRDDIIAIEFRSHLDELTPKITQAHYRRYINPELLINQVMNDYSASLEYLACGLGMAKYKQDDAHVARIVFRKT